MLILLAEQNALWGTFGMKQVFIQRNIGLWEANLYGFPFCRMADLTREQGRTFINSIRVKNGGIEASDRKKTPEEVLEALQSVRKQLADSTEMYRLTPPFCICLNLLTIPPVSPRNSIRNQRDLFSSSSRMPRTISTNAPMLQAQIHI